MISLLNKAFLNAKKENRPALVSYTVCGDNNKKTSLNILKTISKDLDIVEWGMAFNCPTADGKEIQNSSYRALTNGIKLKDVFTMVKKYKKDKFSKPLILMGYYQMIFNFGEKKFIKKCKEAGVNGLIVVDLSYPDNKKFAQLCKKNSINSISAYECEWGEKDNVRTWEHNLDYPILAKRDLEYNFIKRFILRQKKNFNRKKNKILNFLRRGGRVV